MPRSGSTFTFNMARETLLRRGSVAAIAGDSLAEALNHLAGEDHLLIKSHGTDEPLRRLIQGGGAVCVCSYRKPEEAVASWMRTFDFGFEHALQLIEAWIQWHAGIAHLALNIDYREIERRPLWTILRIQHHLTRSYNLPEALRLRRLYSREEVARRVTAMKPGSETIDGGFSYYDKVTFFHRRHISPPDERAASDTLAPGQIHEVRTRLAAHLDANGNYVVLAGRAATRIGQ
jgi:hypothetical protein